jgi:UDP-N-acetylmuramate--alanine ligase
MSHLRIGVLMGGKSLEREVSLNSGRTICDHLDTSRYQVIPIYQTAIGTLYILPWVFLHRGKTNDFEHRLQFEAEEISWDALKERVDFIYIALHGRYGEDGVVQGFLEILQIPYFGSKVFASALGMHKGLQKDFLHAEGIMVPEGIVVKSWQIQESQELLDIFLSTFLYCKLNKLNFPLIVKPVQEGSSFGVAKVEKKEDLLPALQAAANINGRLQDVIIEECIDGMEFSCIIITDYKTGQLIALPPTEIEIEEGSLIFDYEQKYMPGRAIKHTPARCSEEALQRIQETCKKVFAILGFENLGRIDGFLTQDGRIIITDPNSFSGMAPSSYAFLQAAQVGINHTALINHLIETELHAYGMLTKLEREEQKEISMAQTAKVRIAVLLGGVSNEKEISLESGRNIAYKLSPQKYSIKTLFLNKNLQLYDIPSSLLVCNSTYEIEKLLMPEMRILWNDMPKLFDFVFIALHGGVGENGVVQGTLEMLGLPYNGSGVLSSALCIDKYKTNEFLQSKGFDVPKHWLVNKDDFKKDLEFFESFNFPLIVKPHNDGCSVMVQKVQNKDELQQALAAIFAHGKSFALVEEFVVGMELTVGVVGNDAPRALPPSQAVAAAGILSIEEKFLPGAGENQTPAPLPHETLILVQKTIEEVYSAIGCKGYARIDCFYQTAKQSPTGSERVIILEINTLPGMTPATCLFHQAAEVGIKPMDFVDLIVQLGFELHKQYSYLNNEQRNILKQEVNL